MTHLPLLIINPNTSTHMTEALSHTLSTIVSLPTPPTYFTSPSPGIPSINSSSDCHSSAHSTLPHILPLIPSHSAFLIACYSDHPLVNMIKQLTPKPVIGIFEASVIVSLGLLKEGETFGIVSTGKVWEELLGNAVGKLLGVGKEKSGRFGGVETTGLTAVELHDTEQEEVEKRIKEATKRLIQGGDGEGEVGAICLGCAGMTGMEEWVREACVEVLGAEKGERVRIVDGAKTGVAVLEGLVRAGF